MQKVNPAARSCLAVLLVRALLASKPCAPDGARAICPLSVIVPPSICKGWGIVDSLTSIVAAGPGLRNGDRQWRFRPSDPLVHQPRVAALAAEPVGAEGQHHDEQREHRDVAVERVEITRPIGLEQ